MACERSASWAYEAVKEETMKAGCYTALITPFKGDAVDWKGLDRLVDFQIQNGITGILAVGTTGESPVLTWEEHNEVTGKIARQCRGQVPLHRRHRQQQHPRRPSRAPGTPLKFGAQAVLLVDPYYNGPSSLEIRREYVAPVAKAFPQIDIIPYVIPGRTGTQLLPEDLGLACSRQYPNVNTVKEATGSIENMRRTRECCGPDFTILSGRRPHDGRDDDRPQDEGRRA
ncbi:MAG: dihydrodipicolinate synthase family protein [Desulfobacterales bacterium]|nr:dihydrodipicolinate synthase family protein [Desulfobacterales bacterium]